MGGRASRIKGHSFERSVAKDLREIFGLSQDQIKRGLQSRNGMDEVPDVICPAFSIECKAYKKNPPIMKAFKQAEKVAKGKIPVAIVKVDYEEPLATLPYKTFLQIVRVLNFIGGVASELGIKAVTPAEVLEALGKRTDEVRKDNV